ncbi:glycine/betaine ABC transporter permease, partial [Cribrihabitans sp. XS_ASV171]
MTSYEKLFDRLGLRDWCDAGAVDSPMSMAQLLAQTSIGNAENSGTLPFPSLDVLHEACNAIPQTRDMTVSVEQGFLAIKDSLKFILDPLTQPLSWILEGALFVFTATPWWVLIPLLVLATWLATRTPSITV